MIDFVLILSLTTIAAIVVIMGYLGVYAWRHIQADSSAHPAINGGKTSPHAD